MPILKSRARKAGAGFGITTGVITTLGIMVGLYSSTSSFLAVAGGVLSVALADAFSDSVGMHITEESQGYAAKEIWEATLFTFIAKFVVGGSFIVPLLLFELQTAVLVAIGWGLILLIIYNIRLAMERENSIIKTVGEHLGLAILVIIATYYLGRYIAMAFV